MYLGHGAFNLWGPYTPKIVALSKPYQYTILGSEAASITEKQRVSYIYIWGPGAHDLWGRDYDSSHLGVKGHLGTKYGP